MSSYSQVHNPNIIRQTLQLRPTNVKEDEFTTILYQEEQAERFLAKILLALLITILIFTIA